MPARSKKSPRTHAAGAVSKKAVRRLAPAKPAKAGPSANGSANGSLGGKPGKHVYYFGKGKTEGNAKMKQLLGGKGANLADMTSIGLPVPPGFTITTDTCALYYKTGKRIPHGLMNEVQPMSANGEESGKKFGDPANPLLVSVRSRAASMPGMMDTILNLGLTDAAAEGLAKATGNKRSRMTRTAA